jgi:ribosomal protein RSM22 (predicted rRNA methylase)
MNFDTIDWDALSRMRFAFLSGTAGAQDYWQSESDLAAYDATFAQRIGWKWDYVLAELRQRGWSPPPGDVFDWGCGSGVAARAYLDHFGTTGVEALRVWDRSVMAINFAARRSREKYPSTRVIAETKPLDPQTSRPPAVLLISHVLTELTQEQTQALVETAATAQCVIWVEPGTYEVSLTLIAIREKIRAAFNIIAPCTHQDRCGILSPENERHWCHHFAEPPGNVFMDGGWAQFANITGVDLRDLPLSFLVLDKRPAPQLPPGCGRIIGHPRIYKPYALVLGCDDSGVSERRLTKRNHPEEFRAMRKGEMQPLQIWETKPGEIIQTKPFGK